MRRLVVSAALFLTVFLVTPRLAHLDHNGDFLPGDITSWPAQHRALERGYLRYCFDQTAGAYPSFRGQARQVADAAAAMTGINAVEVAWNDDCDVRNTMPPDNQFVTTCGTGAAACIYYYTDPVTIYYRRTLGFSDWKSALCHEGAANSGHLMGQHEEYNDRDFRSNGRFDTCMDFGTFVWSLPSFDRDRIFNAWVPDAPSFVTLRVDADGWATVGWSQTRADNGLAHSNGNPKNSNATRMRFGHSDFEGGPITWAGEVCGERFGFCFTDYKTGNRRFDAFWRGCIYLRAENPMTVFVPQISAPNFWSLAGCW